ncbi:hypothetical protein ACSTS3_22750 [Aquimarina muelleri]|uniref:hypothetical protein n=1 Tax=Aquimarina muelleri TaxID=279356 RepID=UPI003F686395
MLSDTTNAYESLIWGNKKNSKFVTCSFRKRVIEIAKNLGLPQKNNKGANWLMAVMALETEGTFDYQTDNGIGYVGLVQFGEDAVKDIGTTQKSLLSMSRFEQLDYVEQWIGRKKDKINCLTDVYLSVLLPDKTGKGSDKDLVLWTSDREAYYNNPAFHKEKDEWKTLNHRGKFNKKGKKIYKRGYTENGTTYMWEVTQEIEQWYNEGTEKKNNCNDGSCTLSNQDNADLDIKAGIDWLETLSVTKSDLDSAPNNYKVSYAQESGSKANLRSELTEDALSKMDCSELVCRYLNKIGWSSDIKKYTTLDLKNLANKHPEWLERQDENYKPKTGDIFLWRTHKGHTGVIVDHNEATDSVTTIESISEKEYESRTFLGENSGHEGYDFKGVVKWKWNKRTGRHLTGHKSGDCRFYTPKVHYTKTDK